LFQDRFAPGDSQVLSGSQATKEALRKLLPTQRFVHLATHGFFAFRATDAYSIYDVAARLDSGLVLAGANTDSTGADSLLTAEEIGEFDLRTVDLLALSACETGLGHIRAGQGMVGLLGALDQAGVRTVLSALWQVDDVRTAQFMESFYRHLLRGDHAWLPAAALKATQLEMIRRGENPTHWAAWTVTGDPGAVEVR
jgi:CHAT domain-containing protein